MPFFNYSSLPSLKIWDQVHGPIVYSDQLLFGYFTIDEGADLPMHQHPHEQWSHILEGEFEFNIGGEIKIVKPGMAAYMPGGVPHGGKALTKCLILDCFNPVRADFIEKEKEYKKNNPESL